MKFKVMALAALVGFSAMSVQAGELPDGPHIVTSGTASVDAAPDIATLAIEVNVAAKDAATAKKQADERVAQYLSFLEQNQVAKKDISSANLRTQPDYDYQNGKSILKGYRAVRTVEVTLRQLDKLNPLLDGALKAGLNEIRSVSLGVAQPDAYKDKARKAAIDDAIHQAQELAAQQAGAGLQRALSCLELSAKPGGADDESGCGTGICSGNLRAGSDSV